MLLSRREFVQTSAVGALAACALGQSQAPQPANRGVLVVLHLRGGWDGLHALAPICDPECVRRDKLLGISARPAALRMPAYEQQRDWRLHPAAAPLAPLFLERSLTAFPRFGALHRPRGHVDGRQVVSRARGRTTGWIADLAISRGESVFAVTPGHPPLDISGLPVCVLALSPCTLVVRSGRPVEGIVSQIGSACLTEPHPAVSLARRILARSTGAPRETGLARTFGGICTAMSEGLDITAAVIEDHGWDTHEGQERALALKLAELSAGLADFWEDLGRLGARANTCVLVTSEFGRAIPVNRQGGTDHGHAGLALMLGAGNGGVRGVWDSLRTDQTVLSVDPALIGSSAAWSGSTAAAALAVNGVRFGDGLLPVRGEGGLLL